MEKGKVDFHSENSLLLENIMDAVKGTFEVTRLLCLSPRLVAISRPLFASRVFT